MKLITERKHQTITIEMINIFNELLNLFMNKIYNHKMMSAISKEKYNKNNCNKIVFL